jgi:hypothetical protein
MRIIPLDLSLRSTPLREFRHGKFLLRLEQAVGAQVGLAAYRSVRRTSAAIPQ